jgi:glycosyltransferase involved in cell wall biosynthesis
MYQNKIKHDKTKVLVEMRPAFDGFAGIPQEVRLLFRGLRQLPHFDVEGLLQTSNRFLSPGLTDRRVGKASSTFSLNRYSKVIISLAEQPHENLFDRLRLLMRRRMSAFMLTVLTSIGIGRIRLTRFKSGEFKDFTWRTLFSKSLPARDFELAASADHRICSVPWKTMHMAGLSTLTWRKTAIYPKIRTPNIDIFIGQTPYPGRVSANTTMVIRYHDAIPVLMPHTIPEKANHQATHFRALQSNIEQGAWFACVSETTRQDLIKLFPQAEPRALTIHNMVSHNYFPEEADCASVKRIVRARLYEQSGWLPKFLTSREKEFFYRRHLESADFRYLLMVSTIEPRKNHTRLIAAWELIKATIDPNLKLVIVGTLGWDNSSVQSAISGWVERGEAFMLNAVPAGDLRTLYRNAGATVCPSLGEGFDFSGVEAMRSGGVTIASDIPVHREVYDDAAVYFDPYSTVSLAGVIKEVLYSENSYTLLRTMQDRGQEVSKRYLPEVILPQWEALLAGLSGHLAAPTDAESADALEAVNVLPLQQEPHTEAAKLTMVA